MISGSDEPGEGEHKLFAYIRNFPIIHELLPTVIYGLDADLIMLTINHLPITKNLYLFRETPHFIKHIDSTLNPDEIYMMDIPELASIITADMNNNKPVNSKQEENRLYDYILLCFFLGNDFMPHFPALNIRTSGIYRLISAYKHVIGNTDKNLTNGRVIYWNNIRKLVEHLSESEYKYIIEEYKKRENGEKRALVIADTPEEQEEKALFIPTTQRQVEKYINPMAPCWEHRYYKSLFHIDIDNDRRKQICINYMEALEWTMKYYTTGCPDWSWYYKYDYAPLLSDLVKYIPVFDTTFVKTQSSIPIHPYIQLAYVLPKESLYLLPEEVKDKLLKNHDEWYGDEWPLQWAFCKYFWEAHAIMPEISLDKLQATIGK